ncbi:hypothetical protein V9T40_011527 [Parthenolecanium corni]|uniref:TEP1-F n=1 Tax=Parthenolecanium corni TaxID=536013 RepID=A0AAN9TKN1_9HEMI
MQNTSEPTFVVVEISGNQDSGGIFKTTDSVSVEPFSTRIVRLEISDISSGSYSLSVRGSGGLNFRNSTNLEYIHKSYSVFVQTDKAIYKPGHVVMFRVLVLNPSLRPVSTSLLNIHVTDGKGNRIKEWRKQSTTHGVFSSELQLSEHPVLGNWNITVSVVDQIFSKSFEVAEYVLPKFEVKINVPTHATFKDSKLVAVIYAKYVYGKPVKGEATVSVNPNIHSGVIQPFLTNPIFKVVTINGKATVEFDITKDLRITDDYERIVQFDVFVEESLTGRRQNNTAQVLLHRHRYRMELVKTREYFKPGLKYTAQIKLLYHDGSPVTDEVNMVKVRQYYSYDEENFKESKHKLSESGIIELQYFPPHNASVLRIEAEYLDLKEALPPIAAAVSPSNTFIQAVLKTHTPKINSLLEVEVTSTRPVEYVNYEIFARGGIITANTFVMPRNSSTATIKVMATQTMAPNAHFIVHFINEVGEVVADELEIELSEILQNYVHAKSDKSELEPGSVSEITLEAKPYSFIGVLGVDQSVLLLRSGNDITQNTVLKELQSYDQTDPEATQAYRELNDERTLKLLPSSFTAEQAFTKSGALVLSNGYVHEFYPGVYYRTNAFDELDDSSISDDHAARKAKMKPNNSSSGEIVTLKPDIGPPVVYRLVTRPPLAGPFAFSNIPTPAWNHPRVFLDHDIADTWLFNNYSVGSEGRAVIRKNIPDSITSWVISAFSIDNLFGLGLLDEPLKMKTFKSFFITLDLPYSVQRGEVVAIQSVVFNYMKSDVIVDVTLENSGEFEFADFSNDIDSPSPTLELFRRRKVTVPSGSGKSVTFVIRPRVLGYIGIKLMANGRIAGDAIEKRLLVKPEGETIYKNKAMFVDLRTQSSFEKKISLNIPKNVIPGSEYIEVSVIGDIIGSSILNIDKLIRMPHGCGEQNMLNFVPSIVALDYLKNTHRLTVSQENRAIKYLESGYQQELAFRRPDGSFSAFGMSDPSGSTWLTAFVAKSFRQASGLITIEESVITDALQWLANHQASNGSFPEVGRVYHAEMQGGSTHELTLTAYTLIAFLENIKIATQFRSTISRSIEYIVRNLYQITEDSYALALCSYALHLADHPEKESAFSALESNAQTEGDLKFWKRKDRDADKNNPWTKVPNSVNIEMTSYALLSYIKRRMYEDAIPVLSWLITQQNSQGGFASTQDTIIAIYALSQLSEIMSPKRVNLIVNVTTDDANHKFTVNEENSMAFQKYEVHPTVRNISISSFGTGFSVIYVSYQYNVNVTGEWPLFNLDPQLTKSSTANHMQLSVCTSFVGGNNSNMAVMEVNLPSGFTVDTDAIPSLLLSYAKTIKKVETKNGETTLVLYFDSLSREEICPTVSAFRTHKVAHQKPVPVVQYDYYDQTRRSRTFYEVPTSNICDICEESDCSNICQGKLKFQKSEKDSNNFSTTSCTSNFILVTIGLTYAYVIKYFM